MSYVRYNVDDCDDTRSIAGLRGPHFHKDSCLDKEIKVTNQMRELAPARLNRKC